MQISSVPLLIQPHCSLSSLLGNPYYTIILLDPHPVKLLTSLFSYPLNCEHTFHRLYHTGVMVCQSDPKLMFSISPAMCVSLLALQ